MVKYYGTGVTRLPLPITSVFLKSIAWRESRSPLISSGARAIAKVQYAEHFLYFVGLSILGCVCPKKPRGMYAN